MGLIDNIKKIKNRSDAILGINRRNQQYTRQVNPVSAKKIADSKLLTKRLLKRAGIPVTETYKVIRTKKQLEYVDWESLPKSFVVKPNQGSRGRGIIIFYGKRRKTLEWIKPNDQIMNVNELKLHIQNILEGRYSLFNRRDIAIVEERIKLDKLLKRYSYKGLPDIRVIVYNNIPIMAMLRLATKKSNGLGNLHAGGIGVGIDIASGITTNAVQRNYKSILEYDFKQIDSTQDLDENLPLSGIQIPFWDQILDYSIHAQKVSGLGYLGADITLDRDKGPLILELNARPGLGIQVVNNSGLKFRLERVEGISVKSVKHGIRIAKNLFGGQVSEEIEKLSGKQIVNLVEKITLYGKTKTKSKKKRIRQKQDKMVVRGLLDTGVITSRIDKGTVAKIGYLEAIRFFNELDTPKSFDNFTEAQKFIDANTKLINEYDDITRLAKVVEEGKIKVRPVIKIKIKVRGEEKTVEAIISSRKELIYPILLGRKELKEYLIDAGKTFVK